MRCFAAILVACALAAAGGGCGGDGGVEEGATVSVYVDAGLCAGAQQALVDAGGQAGSVRVRATCLAPAREGRRVALATVGANARRASEDSAAVAYLEGPDPAVARFAHPIIESAGIGWTESSSGATAMRQALRAIADADPSQLRDEVRETLEAE